MQQQVGSGKRLLAGADEVQTPDHGIPPNAQRPSVEDEARSQCRTMRLPSTVRRGWLIHLLKLQDQRMALSYISRRSEFETTVKTAVVWSIDSGRRATRKNLCVASGCDNR
ncbi:hypothetical protein [Burkholderia sp. Bp8963]|uniref:hypothetical protein n=1 Tax=Burkholderia sp. Bp8963 TaxID=2184547 RepID=UPI000F596E8B|nr:hypothetical protein [Burkholderia sp. Bp8963]